MRRYVQSERQVPKAPRSKRPSKPRRKLAALTADEMSSIPVHLLPADAQPILAKKSNLPKRTPLLKLQTVLDKENNCRESVFINSRAAGSKQLDYKRVKSQPLRTIDDRLAQLVVVSREDDTFDFRDNIFHYTEWTCHKPIQHDVNIHLLDYNEPEPEIKYTHVTLVTLKSKPANTDYLLITPAGHVCPNCKTSEYIKSDLKDMPVSYQDANWRNQESFGSACAMCRCISQPGE